MLEDLIRKNRSCRRFIQSRFTGYEYAERTGESGPPVCIRGQFAAVEIRYLLQSGEECRDILLSGMGCLSQGLAGSRWKVNGHPVISLCWGIRPLLRILDAITALPARAFCWAPEKKGFAGCMLGAVNREKLRDDPEPFPRSLKSFWLSLWGCRAKKSLSSLSGQTAVSATGGTAGGRTMFPSEALRTSSLKPMVDAP